MSATSEKSSNWPVLLVPLKWIGMLGVYSGVSACAGLRGFVLGDCGSLWFSVRNRFPFAPMFAVSAAAKIYRSTGVADLRKGFNCLYSIIEYELKAKPLSGDPFIFSNRTPDCLKVFV